jgi:hypothetical protein
MLPFFPGSTAQRPVYSNVFSIYNHNFLKTQDVVTFSCWTFSIFFRSTITNGKHHFHLCSCFFQVD